MLIMIAQLFLSLSILIILHELGHFSPAKWFGTRVEKFYLFFDPWFSLWKTQKGETEYGIGWLPLGGYVKISGMVDESFDTDFTDAEPQPWEFRSKPAWQRLIIMIDGVTVNFILGFFIFGMILWHWGEEYLPAKNAIYGIHADSVGLDMGLQHGDKVLGVGDFTLDKFDDAVVRKEIILNNAKDIRVERNGRNMDIPVDPKFVDLLSRSSNANLSIFHLRFPFIIDSIPDGSPMAKNGIQKGDRLIGINNEVLAFNTEFRKGLKKYAGQDVQLLALRNNRDTVRAQTTISEAGLLGIFTKVPLTIFETEKEEYSLARALPAGVAKGMGFLGDQFKAFGQMFKGKIKASESLGGFGSIGKMFGKKWDWYRFWRMTAILSLILAVMNLLPIPALDGGYVMFLLWEMVTGKKVSDKFMEKAVTVGFILILALMVYANGLDIFRAWFQ